MELPCGFRIRRNSSLEINRAVLQTIYEALMRESSHFNSNQHRGIRVSPRVIVQVNVARANGDNPRQRQNGRTLDDQREIKRNASTLPRIGRWIGRSPA